MATRGLGKSHDVPSGGGVRPRFERRLWLRPGDETDIVLCDDVSYNIYEHAMFLKGDKTAAKIKVTCLSDEKDGDPQRCRLCNAQLRHDLIGRTWVGFLTVIDLSKRTWQNREITHEKLLIPLDKKIAMRLDKRRETKGSLVGAHFHLYRTDSNASRVGDDWELMGFKDLKKFFAKSPRIPEIIEYNKKRDGTILTPAQARDWLVTPYDYDEILAHTQKRVTYFLAYLGIDDRPKDGEEGADASTVVDYGDGGGDFADGAGTDHTDDGESDADAKPKGGKKKGVKKKGGKKKSAKKKGPRKKGIRK